MKVCPTRVGVHPALGGIYTSRPCLPHASGGPPAGALGRVLTGLFAPREWGSTATQHLRTTSGHVCPTRVGVHREYRIRGAAVVSLPHASGGPPHRPDFGPSERRFAPREWGSTGLQGDRMDAEPICPTRVGVHRVARLLQCSCSGLPPIPLPKTELFNTFLS